jgi:hypothetical protein
MKMDKFSRKNLFITRIDSRNTHGWYVRIYRKGSRDPVSSKLFSDLKCNGNLVAYKLATKWRDAEIEKHGIKKITTSAHVREKRSKTGVVGVCFSRDVMENTTRVYCRAQATLNGVFHSKSWSIRKWGYKGAWSKAVNYRYNLTGVNNVPLEPPKPVRWIKEWAKHYDIDLSK